MKYLHAICFFSLITMMICTTATAQGENVVCYPDPLYLSGPGDDGLVHVRYLGGGSGPIYGYSIKFGWDATKVSTSVAQVFEGELLSQISPTQFFVYELEDSIVVDCVLLGDHLGSEELGTLFSIQFTGESPGLSAVDLSLLSFRDSNNVLLTDFFEADGLIIVDPPDLGCEVIDYVDIGDETSEAGHQLDSWGPIEPDHSGGYWGVVDNCRVIYASEENGDGTDWASVVLDFGDCANVEKRLTMRHLDRIEDDAFDIYIHPVDHPEEDRFIYSYHGNGLTPEIWYETTIPIEAAGLQVVTFISTEPTWEYWDIYGQVAFDVLTVEQCRRGEESVDMGLPDSELWHNPTGWGPIEPAHAGDGFGGIEDCRVVFASEDNDDGNNWATVDLYFGSEDSTSCLDIHYMDSPAFDSFDVFLYPIGHPEQANLIYEFNDYSIGNETWHVKRLVVDASCMQTVMIVSTGPQWDGWETYGQLAIDTLLVESCIPTDIFDPDPGDIRKLYSSAHPNPFHDETALEFSLTSPGSVSLSIYDISGRLMNELISGTVGAGEHRVVWDGKDAIGHRLPAGVYVYRMEVAGRVEQSGKLILVK